VKQSRISPQEMEIRVFNGSKQPYYSGMYFSGEFRIGARLGSGGSGKFAEINLILGVVRVN